MEEVNVTIIGAGVVGLAIAAELSKRHKDIVVLERHNTFGQETSSRNSEVIHSGIYYPEGSLKAMLCVEGAERLYDICARNSIPFKKLGKLIIATEESEVGILGELLEKGRRNNVKNLELLNRHEINKIEPNTNAVAGLYSPHTGIIDSHSLMKYFYNTAAQKGVLFSFNCEVNLLEKQNDSFMIGIKEENYRFRSKAVINSAGLSSDYIAGLSGINLEKCGYKIKYCKGSYFQYIKPSPVRILIYPVPHEDLVGLGVHATLDMGNRLRFGPDTEYTDAVNYKVDSSKGDIFFKGASKIIPGLEKNAFIPDMAGVRPKLHGPGEKIRDFIISEETDRGLPGLINLIGIESPGLTASPSIAMMVGGMVPRIVS